MADHSSIEWTDATWNPTTGCTKISPGCAHCYIERTPAFRIHGRKFRKGHIPLQVHEDRLEQPLHWQKPRRIFVNSLSDLFHDDVPFELLDRVFTTVLKSPQHIYQVLTKRPGRMQEYFRSRAEMFALYRGPVRSFDRSDVVNWPPANVWLGVSVENQHFADERIPLLLQTPAAVRFISAEPLLGELDVSVWLPCHRGNPLACFPGDPMHECCECANGRGTGHLDWVIVGGESGPKSRDCDVAWVRSIEGQCLAAGVPCFAKQLGRQPRVSAGVYLNLRDKKGGNPSEWPKDLRVREWPAP